MVLGIVVDLLALPYLLCLSLWVLTEWASPFGHFQVSSDHTGRRRAISRSSVYSQLEKRVRVGSERHPLLCQAFRSERWAGVRSECRPLLGQAFRSKRRVGVRSERRSSLARPSNRRGGLESEPSVVPLWPGLPVGEAGRSRKRAPFLLGQAFRSDRGAGVGS